MKIQNTLRSQIVVESERSTSDEVKSSVKKASRSVDTFENTQPSTGNELPNGGRGNPSDDRIQTTVSKKLQGPV